MHACSPIITSVLLSTPCWLSGTDTSYTCVGYYGEDVAVATFTLRRNRDVVANQRCIRQLAGVEQYQALELRRSMPLLEMPENELYANLYRLQQ